MPNNDAIKFRNAAFEFCSAEIALRKIKAAYRHCSEDEPPSHDGVYPGNPPCKDDADDDALCENCLARRKMYPLKVQAMKDRAKVKQKMMRWFARVAE